MSNEEMNRMIAATALRKMFTDGNLSICTIDRCIELMGLMRNNGGKSYERLRALHCVYFKDMPAEIADQIPTWIGDCLNGTSIDALMEATKPASQRNGAHMLRHLQ